MVDVPAATPLTTPVVLPTLAIVVVLLLQVPPRVVMAKVVVEPEHTVAVPVILPGVVYTLSVLVAFTHPLPRL